MKTHHSPPFPFGILHFPLVAPSDLGSRQLSIHEKKANHRTTIVRRCPITSGSTTRLLPSTCLLSIAVLTDHYYNWNKGDDEGVIMQTRVSSNSYT
jgi:hypothetical protein